MRPQEARTAQSKDASTADGISHLRCREIQAPIAALLIRAFATELGHDRAVAIATEAVRADAAAAGHEMAEKLGGNSLADLARAVREVWCRDDAMRIRVLKESHSELHFDVTQCGYAETYAKLGIQDLGVCLSCCRDEPLARAFNPRVKLKRTQTIMEGAAHCDFRYALE